MRSSIPPAVTLAALAISLLSITACEAKSLTAQQQLMKTCNASAKEQALKGAPRKAFMKKCLSGDNNSQQALMKTCNSRATNLKGDERKSFMRSCLSGDTTTATATARTSGAPAATLASDQFSTEGDAKRRCPTDSVVWVNPDSNVYHFAGASDYGKTNSGFYMCQKEADAAGDHAAKNEKLPR